MSLLLRNARLMNGALLDVAIEGERIAAVGPSLPPPLAGREIDLAGMLLLPSFVEPHAHLDKALLADRIDNPTGDLLTAIEQIHANYHTMTVDDIADRAERAVRILVASGTTAIRTHVDVNTGNGLRSVEALIRVRERVKHLADLQLVALVRWRTPGEEGTALQLLLDAVSAGADVVGGCPHLEPDPIGTVRTFVELAGELGCPIDLHTDETLDPGTLTVLELARLVQSSGFDRGVAASHCVSLGVQPLSVQRSVADLLATAGVAVIALPQTNLFLQARNVTSSPPRGLTAVHPLLEAGATVAAGADNLQDPFNTVGRGDPLETAALMVMAAHTTPAEAYAMVSEAGRLVLGLPAVSVSPGSPAELVAIDATSVRAAIGFAPMSRVVIHRGELVSQTVVTTR